MTAQIEVSVKVYLYEQVENSEKTDFFGEIINFAEVYPTWERAEQSLKIIEVKDKEDGVAFDTAIGRIYQYHHEYKNDKGERVWEIRHERFRKDGKLGYDACRVIEKTF